MIRHLPITPNKTYANATNAKNAIARMLDKNPGLKEMDLNYSIIWNEEGRCYPVFFGMSAFHAGIPHLGFNCVHMS